MLVGSSTINCFVTREIIRLGPAAYSLFRTASNIHANNWIRTHELWYHTAASYAFGHRSAFFTAFILLEIFVLAAFIVDKAFGPIFYVPGSIVFWNLELSQWAFCVAKIVARSCERQKGFIFEGWSGVLRVSTGGGWKRLFFRWNV